MTGLLQADIFFFLASLFLIGVGVAGLVAAVYLILLIRDLRSLIKMAKLEGLSWLLELKNLRERFQRGGEQAGSLVSWLFSRGRKPRSRKKAVSSEV